MCPEEWHHLKRADRKGRELVEAGAAVTPQAARKDINAPLPKRPVAAPKPRRNNSRRVMGPIKLGLFCSDIRVLLSS